jgi:hypothetical protein
VLASCSTDKTIKIWNLSDYSCINTFEGHLSSVLRIHWVYFGTHVISAGADGLVKFWNLKTSECLNTINAHEGKIWALDVLDETGNKNTSTESQEAADNSESEKRLNNFRFITGGTDSKITIWTDVTAQKETETLRTEEDKILKTERLRIMNDNKEYYDAMRLALDLNHKNYFMSVLKNFVNDNLKSQEETSSTDPISIIINNRKHLDEHDLDSNTVGEIDSAKMYKENLNKILKDSEFRKIIHDNIDKVLEISRDNNIRASGFLYAQIILKLILVSTNFEDFVNKNHNKKLGLKNKGLRNLKIRKLPQTIDYIENFEIVKSYSQKHLERINRELTKSFLIDHVIEKMKII